jgi:hypothetical protein
MRHEYVGDNQFGKFGLGDSQSFYAIRSFQQAMTKVAQERNIPTPVSWVGVNDKNSCHRFPFSFLYRAKESEAALVK